MKTISRELIPKDFTYYRSGSKVFYEYYKNHKKFLIQKTGNGYDFIKACKLFGSQFWSVIAEKIDTEPSKELINSLGIKHAIVHRIPFREIRKPKGWFRLPKIITKDFAHSSRSAFCILDREDYWNKWTSKARGHRNKILELKSKGILQIEKCEDLDVFLNVYSSIKVKDPNHKWLINWCNSIFPNPDIKEKLKVYLASVNGQILAGAVFIEQGVTSEYFTSFYIEESKPYHLGIAIMDAWFCDSYKNGMKYCDLDHMQDLGQLSGYAGYTKFKESIADYDVYFHDMFIKIF